MYRLRPDYEMRARAIEEYPGKSEQAKLSCDSRTIWTML
jgi:hypothetical protein